jgi:uncharacterized phage protein gp47/JayE
MSSYGLTPEGFHKKRLDDLVTQLEGLFKGVYGSNFKVRPETKQGQLIAGFAKEFSLLWDIAEDSFNALNPSAALDTALENLVQYNLITKQPATYSTVTLTVVGSVSTLIPAGSQVQAIDDSSIRFETIADVTLTGGSDEVLARALTTGPIEAEADTLTVIFTPVSGWASVTNDEDATLGTNEESNEELRARRARSTSINGQRIIDATRAQLEALDNVITALVLENDTNVDPDANGVPAHSIEAIVRGGDSTEIKDVLLLNKTPGIPYVGNTNVPATDSQGVPVDINYTIPDEIPILVEITLVKDSDYPASGDTQIKQNIIDYAAGLLLAGRGFENGDDVILSELYTPINFVPGHSIVLVRISKDPDPLGTINVPIDVREIATFEEGNISIL